VTNQNETFTQAVRSERRRTLLRRDADLVTQISERHVTIERLQSERNEILRELAVLYPETSPGTEATT
jgi:hypothetical protein